MHDNDNLETNNIHIAFISVLAIVLIVYLIINDKPYRYSTTEEHNLSNTVLTASDPYATDNMVFDCPFCSGQAKVLPSRNKWFIECDTCYMSTYLFDSKEELINYWNRVYSINDSRDEKVDANCR